MAPSNFDRRLWYTFLIHKEESYFDEVNYEMGIDFVTSKTFDKEHLKFPKIKEKEKNFAQSCSNSNSRELSNEETSCILEKNLTKKSQ